MTMRKEIRKQGYIPCKYCELPIEEPAIIGTFEAVGIRFINWGLFHKHCYGPYLNQMRNLIVTIILFLFSTIIGLIF